MSKTFIDHNEIAELDKSFSPFIERLMIGEELDVALNHLSKLRDEETETYNYSKSWLYSIIHDSAITGIKRYMLSKNTPKIKINRIFLYNYGRRGRHEVWAKGYILYNKKDNILNLEHLEFRQTGGNQYDG